MGDMRKMKRGSARLGLAIIAAMLALAVISILPGGPSSAAFAETRRNGSSVVFGGPIYVAADETVEGDAVSFGGKVTIDGHVTGNAVSIGGPVEVNGVVDGDVVSIGSQVSLGENARVGGDVTSVGGTVYRAEGSIVEGDVRSGGFPFRFGFRGMMWPGAHWMPWNMGPWNMPWGMSWGFFGALWIARLLGALVLSLVVVAVWPNHTTSVARAIETKLGHVALTGLVGWLLFVPAIIFLAITLIGIPLIPVWVALYIAAGVLGHAAIAILVGDRIAGLANTTMTMLVKVVVGALIIAVLGWIPGAGFIVAIAVAVIGLGAVLDTRFGTNRPWFPPRQPVPPRE
ncbi:MAG: hypothetical protein HPY71_13125 [Firmicutes bacterium]|nr:hypothetical protein [Bacillota bacterium]